MKKIILKIEIDLEKPTRKGLRTLLARVNIEKLKNSLENWPCVGSVSVNIESEKHILLKTKTK